ncbi:ATP-grasp domain-containing protein [Paenibacillus sp. SGZ-1009]|uniref:ATP-grasp domain-containing protein n=1 Tax=Paenibacillus campi TaxID=3106031 RepID=UPI002AFFE844|nr:ATP-grasp domain-containing protein [Paenibacillus sp. SGZ-1009]
MFLNKMQNLQNRLIAARAQEMGIACELLVPGCEDFLRLSQNGQTIIINKTRSHRLPLLSGLLAKDKQASNLLLQQRGLPVPPYTVVTDIDAAIAFMEQLSPERRAVVVKPLDASRSDGVTLDVRTIEQLEQALERAAAYGSSIMLQQFVTGVDYRVLVIAGKVEAVTCYRPVQLVGDGICTIAELIAQVNEQCTQQTAIGIIERFVAINNECTSVNKELKRQGYTMHTIPAPGQTVNVYNSENMEAGAICELYSDCTDIICRQNIDLSVAAAAALGIDVAGIDIRCHDIARPLTLEQGGILEVNALPDMINHAYPYAGQARDVAGRYLDYLFSEQKEPVIAGTSIQRSVD